MTWKQVLGFFMVAITMFGPAILAAGQAGVLMTLLALGVVILLVGWILVGVLLVLGEL